MENKERVHSFVRTSLGNWPHGRPGNWPHGRPRIYANYVTT
jgi:hypothetical protein